MANNIKIEREEGPLPPIVTKVQVEGKCLNAINITESENGNLDASFKPFYKGEQGISPDIQLGSDCIIGFFGTVGKETNSYLTPRRETVTEC